MFGTIESEDVHHIRPAALAPRGDLAPGPYGRDLPGDPYRGLVQCSDRSMVGVGVGVGADRVLPERRGPRVHGGVRGAELARAPELAFLDPTSVDSEVSRYLMPYPSKHPGVYEFTIKFLQRILKKDSGLTQGEVGAHIREWVWHRREHRHACAIITTVLAFLSSFVGQRLPQYRVFQGPPLWSTLSVLF